MNYYLITSLLGVGLLAMTLMATSQPEDAPLMVNLMLTPDMPEAFSETDITTHKSDVREIYKFIRQKNDTMTIFLTQDSSSEMRALLGQIGLLSGFEYGISGNNSGEKLSTISYSDQLSILSESKKRTEACAICGENSISVKGFMPSSFDQNEDTYKALEELGIEYDAGFQAGIIYAPGHEKDVWPYKLDGYNLYAVPISTLELSGKITPLDDKYASKNGMTSTQWYDLLVAKLDEASTNGEPVVISLSTSVSGTEEYFDALKKFVDYAHTKNAVFVKSYELVSTSKTGVYEPIDLTPDESECSTCNKNESKTVSIVPRNNTTSAINVTWG